MDSVLKRITTHFCDKNIEFKSIISLKETLLFFKPLSNPAMPPRAQPYLPYFEYM